MRRIPSGVTDQYIYFVAVDATDYVTRETGLSSFTVRRSRNGGASAAYTTPTINETDSSNMPGVYELLLDEDMTLDSGDHSQEVCLHITHAGMAPVTLVYELYRPDVTAGETLTVSSGNGNAAVQSIAANAVNASALATDAVTEIQSGLATASALATVDTVVDGIKAVTDALPDSGALTSLATAAALATVDSNVDAILLDTAEIGAAGAGLTAIPWNASWDAEVQSEVTDALNAYDPPTATEMTAAFTEIKGATWDTTDTLEAIRDRGDSAWITATGFSTLNAAGVRSAVGLASANLDTQLGTIDTVADAIKAKTDSLTFSVTGKVDANITHVNEIEVTGDGQSGTEWGPA